MTTQLALYGSTENAHNLSKVGVDKNKAPRGLVARMPSPEIAAKVGGGGGGAFSPAGTRRVVRRNARG